MIRLDFNILCVRFEISYYLCNFIHFYIFITHCFSSHTFTASLYLYQHNGLVSPSSLLIFILCCFSWFPHFLWARPPVWIAAYIGTNFLSYRIIAVHHHFISPQNKNQFNKFFFSKIKDDKLTCTKNLFRIIHGRKQLLI